MMILNMTIANLSRSILLSNAFYNDKIELLKRVLPFAQVYQSQSAYAARALNNEKFVNDFFKYSCDRGCNTFGACVQYYSDLIAPELNNPTGEVHFTYDEAMCSIGKSYESCAQNGYYDYVSDGSSKSWSQYDEESAYNQIYELIVMTPLTNAGLTECCRINGECTEYIETGLYNAFKGYAPSNRYISENLARFVCDESCVPYSCPSGQGVCLPDHCGVSSENYVFGAQYDEYVCKVTKAYLGCNKTPALKSGGLGVGAIIGIVVGSIVLIAIIVVVVCYKTIKFKKNNNNSTSEEP